MAANQPRIRRAVISAAIASRFGRARRTGAASANEVPVGSFAARSSSIRASPMSCSRLCCPRETASEQQEQSGGYTGGQGCPGRFAVQDAPIESVAFSPGNGPAPESISNRTQPKEKMSEPLINRLAPAPARATCIPRCQARRRRWWAARRLGCDDGGRISLMEAKPDVDGLPSAVRARPKSRTLILPSGVTITLPGLRSRWMTPLLVSGFEGLGDLLGKGDRIVGGDRPGA